jgi:hypothetical protein
LPDKANDLNGLLDWQKNKRYQSEADVVHSSKRSQEDLLTASSHGCSAWAVTDLIMSVPYKPCHIFELKVQITVTKNKGQTSAQIDCSVKRQLGDFTPEGHPSAAGQVEHLVCVQIAHILSHS